MNLRYAIIVATALVAACTTKPNTTPSLDTDAGAREGDGVLYAQSDNYVIWKENDACQAVAGYPHADGRETLLATVFSEEGFMLTFNEPRLALGDHHYDASVELDDGTMESPQAFTFRDQTTIIVLNMDRNREFLRAMARSKVIRLTVNGEGGGRFSYPLVDFRWAADTAMECAGKNSPFSAPLD